MLFGRHRWATCVSRTGNRCDPNRNVSLQGTAVHRSPLERNAPRPPAATAARSHSPSPASSSSFLLGGRGVRFRCRLGVSFSCRLTSRGPPPTRAPSNATRRDRSPLERNQAVRHPRESRRSPDRRVGGPAPRCLRRCVRGGSGRTTLRSEGLRSSRAGCSEDAGRRCWRSAISGQQSAAARLESR